jgi:putative heme iron utilization protein
MQPHDTLRRLLSDSLVASLAVRDPQGPAVSLVAFTHAWSPLRVHLFVSDLSAHTPALRAESVCSLMIHAPPSPEDPNSNHALTRVMIRARASFLSRDEATARGIFARWTDKYAITGTLAGLSDFHFVELEPLEATFVMGFGRAFKCSGDDLEVMEHQRPR